MKHTYVFLLIVWLGLLAACTNGFEEMNQDPNNPTLVPTSYLMSAAQTELTEEFFGRYNQGSNWNLTAMRYMQQWTSTLYTGVDRYLTIEGDFSDVYDEGLRDLQEIIRLNTNPETRVKAADSGDNDNQVAVAMILRAWAFHNLTDIWGDIPYSQALMEDKNVSPAYDPQEQIYNGIIEELEEAYAMIDETGAPLQGDLIYNGDMAKWKLFAQSLKLRLGMRLTEAAPAKAEAVVKQALDAGVFMANADNARYTYEGSVPNVNPWFSEFVLETITLAVTNTLVDQLVASEDPRLPFFAKKAEAIGDYVGMPYGVSAAIAGSIKNEEVSLPANAIIAASFPAVLQSYAEVLFLQAEAAARGWYPADAATLYAQAIRASMEQWGVDAVAAEAYLANPAVAYEAGNYRKSIGNQKWLALYLQGLEAWSEWRRLDYPRLVKAPDAASGREIPRRRGYPLTEISLNQASYNEAIARQGPDLLSTRIWWDQ